MPKTMPLKEARAGGISRCPGGFFCFAAAVEVYRKFPPAGGIPVRLPIHEQLWPPPHGVGLLSASQSGADGAPRLQVAIDAWRPLINSI